MKLNLTKYERPNQAVASDVQALKIQINDMYDPFITAGTNTQPNGFDQMMAIYSAFYVYGCLVKFTIQNNDDVSAVASNVYASFDPTDISSDIEKMGCQFQNAHFMLSPENGGRSTMTFKKYYKVKDYLPNSTLELLSGNTSGAPTDPLFLLVNLRNSEAQNLTDVSMQIQLKFYCIFSNPVLQPGS